MNVFLSWSGSLSHEVAVALSDWLPQVLQATKPWLSSQDIEKGARWFQEIGDNLANTDFGLLCLTSSNLGAPWILFEAGALSKSLGQARVCPLLINIRNADIQGPLAQFNTASIGRDDIKRLVESLNVKLPAETRRSELQLAEAFTVWWPHLERKLSEAIAKHKSLETSEQVSPTRTSDDVMDEILELTRASAQQLSRLYFMQSRLYTAQPSASLVEFAHHAGLSPAETRVLEMLCTGASPLEIAPSMGANISTIRTIISSIRAKTGADSVSKLIAMCARLPLTGSGGQQPPNAPPSTEDDA